MFARITIVPCEAGKLLLTIGLRPHHPRSGQLMFSTCCISSSETTDTDTKRAYMSILPESQG